MLEPGAPVILGSEIADRLNQMRRGEQLHGHRCQLSGCAWEANAWKACPASCSRVITSSTRPTAFMKMKGRPWKCSVSQYPPGAFPLRLSRSRSRSSIIVWNSRPRPESRPSVREHPGDRRRHRALDRLVKPLAIRGGVVEAELGGKDVVAVVGEARVPGDLLAQA